MRRDTDGAGLEVVWQPEVGGFALFLETWSGVKATISGSLVSLWFARKAVGLYHSHYCGAPNRDGPFDQRFNDPTNLPPFTPVVGQVVRMGFARRYEPTIRGSEFASRDAYL